MEVKKIQIDLDGEEKENIKSVLHDLLLSKMGCDLYKIKDTRSRLWPRIKFSTPFFDVLNLYENLGGTLSVVYLNEWWGKEGWLKDD